MRKAVIVSFLLILTFTAIVYLTCFRWRSIEISEITQDEDLVLSSDSWDYFPMDRPSGISVWVVGEIEGEAEISAEGLEPQRIKGKIDRMVYHQDWYYYKCDVRYHPLTAQKGKLVIRYRFR